MSDTTQGRGDARAGTGAKGGAQVGVLLACFGGAKAAAKARRGLDAQLNSQGDALLDTVVLQVNANHKASVHDPRRVVALAHRDGVGDVDSRRVARTGEGDIAPLLDLRLARAEHEGALDREPLAGVASERVPVPEVPAFDVAAGQVDLMLDPRQANLDDHLAAAAQQRGVDLRDRRGRERLGLDADERVGMQLHRDHLADLLEGNRRNRVDGRPLHSLPGT